MLRVSLPKLAYTRWKCDRQAVFAPKFFAQDSPWTFFLYFLTFFLVWRHFAFAGNEDVERRDAYYAGYPYWRDPIAKRNEDKNKRLIRDNNIDITDPKWTGCTKAELQ